MHLAWQQAPALFIFSLLANVLLLSSSIYMLQIYDRVLSSGSVDTLLWLTLAVIAATALYGLLEQARRMMLSRIGQWLDDQLSTPVIERSMEARLAGATSEAGLKDISDLRAFIAGDGILAFLDAPWIPVYLAFMWLLHPALCFVGIGGAIVLFGATLANELLTRKKGEQTTAALRRNQAAAGQFVESAETLRSLGMTERALQRWEDKQRSVMSMHGLLSDRTAMIGNLSRSVRLGLQVAILGLGAYLVLRGELTSGSMIAASIVLSRALSPIERSIGAWRSFVSARAARRNLRSLFADENSRQSNAVTLPRPDGRLTIENVYYQARGMQKPLLSKVSFALRAGETCGIIGASGSGKTTLCRLIVGALKPSLGQVRLDGADVSTWASDDLGRHVGYLPQQVDFFQGTIGENIARLGDPDGAAVIAAAQRAGIHEMILRLPKGYETEIGPQGMLISRGQRQRIALARALFGDPPLIVLDEPNSGLDNDGEVALLNVLRWLKEECRTVVLVSHQTNLLFRADRAVLMSDGNMAMFGTRDEVLSALSGQPKRPVVPAQEHGKTLAQTPANSLRAAE